MGNCKDCRHWEPDDDEPGMGQCAQIHAGYRGDVLMLYPRARIGEPLVTPELFGCNQYKAREG